jgi:hypothetical protein
MNQDHSTSVKITGQPKRIKGKSVPPSQGVLNK